MTVITWAALAISVVCFAVGMGQLKRREGKAGVLITVGIVGIGVNGRALADHELLRLVFLVVQGIGMIVMFVFIWKYYRRNSNRHP